MNKAHSFLIEQLRMQMRNKGLAGSWLSSKAGIGTHLFYAVMSGKRSATDEFLHKLAAVDELGLAFEDLVAWRLQDKFGDEQLQDTDSSFRSKLRISIQGIASLGEFSDLERIFRLLEENPKLIEPTRAFVETLLEHQLKNKKPE